MVLKSVVSWPQRRSRSACQQLSNDYSDLVALPNSTLYHEENIGKQGIPFAAIEKVSTITVSHLYCIQNIGTKQQYYRLSAFSHPKTLKMSLAGSKSSQKLKHRLLSAVEAIHPLQVHPGPTTVFSSRLTSCET